MPKREKLDSAPKLAMSILSQHLLLPLAALILFTPTGRAQSAPPPESSSTEAVEDGAAATDSAATSDAAFTPRQILQQAEAAIKADDHATVILLLEPYLAAHPRDFRARFNLAFALSMTRRPADASRHYEQILASQPNLLAARLNHGLLLLDTGNPTGALPHLKAVIDTEPNHVLASVKLAETLSALDRIEEAHTAYSRALQLAPDDPLIHLALANLLASTDPTLAAPHLRRALALDHSLNDARLLLASLLEADPAIPGAVTEATTLYGEYLARHPDHDFSDGHDDLRKHFVELLLNDSRPAEAATFLEATRAAGRSTPSLDRLLLHAYIESKNNPGALALSVELLTAAENTSAPDADLYLIYGTLRMSERNYEQAAQAFFHATQLTPQSAEAFTNFASALYLLDNFSGVIRALEVVENLDADTSGTYFLRAITLDKLGHLEPALDNYQRFLATSDGSNPNQTFQARERSKALLQELRRLGRRR